MVWFCCIFICSGRYFFENLPSMVFTPPSVPPLAGDRNLRSEGENRPTRCSEPLRSKVGGPSKVSPSCAGWDRLAIKMAMVEFVMTFYSSLSKISIISAAVITCGSFGKCLRFPVTKKESSLLRQTS